MSRRNGLAGYVRTRLLEVAAPEMRARSEPLAEWALRSIRLDGKPFTFEGHGYLRAIYDDISPHVVVCKAAQIGGTTWALLRSFHACLSGLNTIYFFPTRSDVLEFSKSRVGPLIAENALLTREVRDTDTAGLKRIGDAHLYLRGLKSAVQVKSVPADLVVFDELDEATPDAKTRAKERLSHSSYKRIIELSNPSLPDFGIDEAYQASDQRHWHLRCPGCGEWTCLERAFPRKLGEGVPILRLGDDGSGYRTCPRCGAELDPDDGEWVADYPGRETHGYLISQLFSSTVDPAEILHEYRTTRHAERFYNLKIGIAWVDRENRLHPDDVLRLCGDGFLEAPEDGRCVMGVDTGRTLHVVIGAIGKSREDRLRIVHLGAHEDFSELDFLMERYRVSCAVVDGLPETHAARAFAARHGGKVYLNFFNEHQRGRAKWDPENRTVQENRTEALDASRSAIRNREVVLPRESPIVRTFADHLSADAKQLVEDEETGAKQHRYLKTGPNHFGMAFTYAWLGYERLRPSRSVLRLVQRDPTADRRSLTAGLLRQEF